ncbi:unnamed protein product [Mytilus edulis]|uniref:Ig-like domain-containing protein n=1 Tax=Mytilus edulis TaxID=6550 RepID=A0A8S3QT12_MYTED|nr:unnamed protein product [Mytilus edulis]
MNEAYVLLILIFNLSLGHSYQSQGIGIKIKGDNVTVTWNKPSSDIKSATLEVNNIVSYKTIYRADLNGTDSLHTVQLSPCQKYKVKLRFVNISGGKYEVDKDFVLGGEYLYTSVDTNITFSIPKLPDHFYTVVSPTGKSILEVQGKHVIVNNDERGRYKIKTTAQHFVISVHNVRQVDGGMFKAKNSELLEGECVVVFVTDKPTTPSISYNEYPFVGNKANFTCISKVQRWPSDNSENLSYKFFWNGESRQPNTIIRRSDTGASVTCQATDDRGQQSPSSDSLILDPYCKPKNVIFQRRKVAIRLNFIEGITMFVESNPTPNVTWIQNSPYPWTISRKYVKTVPKAQISWYSGFDGGAPQNFSINLESTTDGSRTITVPSEKKDEGDLVLFIINGLSSDAYYNGQIVSCNEYGKTEVEFEFETAEVNDGLSERETIIYPLVICGIIGIIVVFVIFKIKEKCKDSKRKILQTGHFHYQDSSTGHKEHV